MDDYNPNEYAKSVIFKTKKKKKEQAKSSYRKLNRTLLIKVEDDVAELISSRGRRDFISSRRRRDFSLLSSKIKLHLFLEISYRNTGGR